MSMISSVSTDIASSALVMKQQDINDLLDHHRKAINHSVSTAMWIFKPHRGGATGIITFPNRCSILYFVSQIEKL